MRKKILRKGERLLVHGSPVRITRVENHDFYNYYYPSRAIYFTYEDDPSREYSYYESWFRDAIAFSSYQEQDEKMEEMSLYDYVDLMYQVGPDPKSIQDVIKNTNYTVALYFSTGKVLNSKGVDYATERVHNVLKDVPFSRELLQAFITLTLEFAKDIIASGREGFLLKGDDNG